MRHLPLTAISVLSALGLAVGTAIAQQTPGQQSPGSQQTAQQPSTQELMTQYDQDGNQTLSQEEFARLYEERLQLSSSQPGQSPGQAQPGQQPQSGQQPQGGQAQQGSDMAAQVFGNLDSDGNSELGMEELSQAITLINPQGGASPSVGQAGQDLNPQVGATTQEGQTGGAQSSTLFAGEVRTDTRDIGTDQPAGEGTSLTGQAGGDRQVGQPAQTAPDSRENAQPGAGNNAGGVLAQNAPGQATQDQQNPQGQFGQQQGAQPGQQQGAQQGQFGQQQGQQPGQTGQQQGQFGQQQGSSQLEQMATTQPDQLRGMAVRTPAGEDLGEIDEVVRDRDNGEIYAVITSGGILGIGADRSAVRISELQMENDAIVYSSTQEQLEQQPYEESRFEPVEAGESQAATEEEQPQERPA